MAPSPTDEDLFAKNVRDVFFDYNKPTLRSDEMPLRKMTASSSRNIPV